MGRVGRGDGTRRHASAAAVGGGKPRGIAARSARRTGETAVVRRRAACRPARPAPTTTQRNTRASPCVSCHGARRSERREDEKRHVRARSRRTSMLPGGTRSTARPARPRAADHCVTRPRFRPSWISRPCFRPRRTSPRLRRSPDPRVSSRVVTDLALDMRVRFGSASRRRSSPSSPPSPPRRICIT